MMAFEKYTAFIFYWQAIEEKLGRKKSWRVLDYGCGVSDVGLFLSKQGAKIILVDLDDQKLDFAQWRYTSRKLAVNVKRLEFPTEIPNIKQGSIDLILATEFLEHVPDLLRIVKSFYRWLSEDGLLLNSMGLDFKRKLKGDHLKQALEIGNSQRYREYYGSHFKPISTSKDLDWLFQKASTKG